MRAKRFVKILPFTLALGVSSTLGAVAAPASQATALHSSAMMQVTKVGTFEKLLSSTSFKISVDMKSYVVKTNSMTHITLNSMKAKLSSLRQGDTVTVKGVLEMGAIIATSVQAGPSVGGPA
jgi:hypothetical protein